MPARCCTEIMKLPRFFSIFPLLLLMSGCLGPTWTAKELKSQVQVFGVELGSAVDYREINSVTAEEEPCLHGYERNFVPLQITVGYSLARNVRKIITRNPATRLFGIHPGMALSAARPLATQAGFAPTALSPHIFRTGDYLLSLQVDGNGTVAALTLEVED